MHPAALASVLLVTLCGLGTAAAAGGDVRARAARDLGCKAVKVQDWGTKIEARGCGRNAEYERTAGGLELVMAERPVTPEMRRQVMTDLECTSGELELTRIWTRESGDEISGSGCAREASYEVKGAALELRTLVRPASSDVAARVAADLGCPPTLEVTVTREADGSVTAGAHDCKDRQFTRYGLEPFRRLGERRPVGVLASQPTASTQVTVPEGDTEEVARVQALKQRAAGDLACADAASITVTLTKSPIKIGGGAEDDDLTAMEARGCGRHAKYERRPAGLVLTYVEQTVRPEWLAQVARELDCEAGRLDVKVYAFPDKGGPARMGAVGCDRQASYEIGGGVPRLTYELSRAPADVREGIARDLGCLPERVQVDLVRRSTKDPWSATGNCPGGHRYMYNVKPELRRIGRAPAGR